MSSTHTARAAQAARHAAAQRSNAALKVSSSTDRAVAALSTQVTEVKTLLEQIVAQGTQITEVKTLLEQIVLHMTAQGAGAVTAPPAAPPAASPAAPPTPDVGGDSAAAVSPAHRP